MVVQSKISANPGLNFNLMFCFIQLSIIAVQHSSFQNFKNIKVVLTQKVFVEKRVQLHKQAIEKFDLNT